MRLNYLAPVVLVSAMFMAFTSMKTIDKCYVDFNEVKGLKAQPAQKITDAAKSARQLDTRGGKVSITREELVKVEYKNEKNAVFATIEVEVSPAEAYSHDTANVTEHLRYLTTMRKDLDTRGLQTLQYNGYTVYGIRSNNTESDNKYLGIYAFFPENGVIAYVYFNKLKKEEKHYENLTDFQSRCNGFLGSYTAHLKKCKGK